jgi:hypothetical protein
MQMKGRTDQAAKEIGVVYSLYSVPNNHEARTRYQKVANAGIEPEAVATGLYSSLVF